MPVINILTYNLHKGFSRYNRDFVLHRVKQHIRQTDVDIVMLQEIQGAHSQHENGIGSWPDVSQFEFLADSIWPHYAYGKNAVYRRGHHGNAILSKYNLEEWSNFNLSRFRGASRSFLHAVVDIQGHQRPLHLVCVHLDLIGFERKRQLKILKTYLDSNIDERDPLIIAGDFNDWHGRLGRFLETRFGMQEALRCLHGSYAKTFPSHRPFLQMDRIYFRGLQLIEAQCLSRYPWGQLSDHLPLSAAFSLENQVAT